MPDTSREYTVVVSQNRYDILLDLETRVHVAVERIKHNEYTRTEDILWILGTEEAIELAEKLREEAKKRDEEFRKKYDFTKSVTSEPGNIEVVCVDELIEEIYEESEE